MRKNIELLSPAGNMEKMKTALAFGADAVYAGIPDFSLRVRINDFDMKKLKAATKYCHSKDKKIYITVNIFAHNHHLDRLPKYIKELKKIKADALIVSDPGIIKVIQDIWPECEIHLSTQANCTNWQSAKFWFESAGVKRIILGREVTLREIKKIHKKVPNVELEYFVHGAMCMSYSGRCFLSKYFVEKSANLGDCAQPCRWKYNVSQKFINSKAENYSNSADRREYFITEEKRPDQPMEIVEDEHGSYILNSRDLCLLKHLKDLRDAGVVSFKIEGRAKSSYYQAVIAGIYKQTIKNIDTITNNEINNLYEELEDKLVYRGYTTGFLLGEKGDQNLGSARVTSAWEFCGQVIDSKKFIKSINSKVNNLKNLMMIKVHNSLHVGDEIEIIKPLYEVVKIRLEKIIDVPSGKSVGKAHGGQDKIVMIECGEEIPEFSVIRRRI
ncbi:hypothetical protein A2331_05775 [Candidatus Falkowbacteria bacterium RIFOXYB2_FULL_34_18]|uniref:Peptidase family U32 C-terminal domain-containing protein n=1 Tax=Candidatus Falkowbacteria bacterium RIFOXYD2_FULL_34_120 TaxID=1798007 RepID=A0A1F5TN42_9BACT|nr:MAG: hypothetical protein A2331_05775 [Candidatus Falkowbacteria bacterium RIFOXYB2_FULL_34_18]OGF29155.1 MAG: hypothetical protein A2500_05720 [Candidatus Falkowbacteria bacterium RIFOXYC12_FULL_34_55]OGF36961.1 MAG: hypothetical protein A2466_07100 [Candidatus Falkowbacteria bacterium RIFOXYC2_FULL_34_220]OGF38677.1 MAG: hypothetical protein A2515_01385 [Candidatus Falkowbacteria bacterium RIFOXYD12_FULL_34_57]OGF39911.1 MAG: hypothetical protein A2531_01640 [Candidatus Falkowbacteria bact